ncbi:MAG: phage major capsid protein, partial [Deltaproteobacteria bacterium]|nr:phage major capsid protein [Deltaproteobacteria bacterium]
MALTLNEIQSTTNEYFLSAEAVDNFYKSNALMFRLSANKKMVDGGRKLKQPLWHAGPGGGAFDANSKFNTQKRQKINAALFDWAKNYEPETYDIDDSIENTGVAAEVDIIMNKLRMMETALMWTMGTQVYGDGTGSPTPITGLLAMLDSTTTTAYGGIQESDLAVWAPGATITTGGTLTLNKMRELRRSCKVSNAKSGMPTIYMTTDTLHDKYDSLLQPQQRYANNEELANAGF